MIEYPNKATTIEVQPPQKINFDFKFYINKTYYFKKLLILFK